MGLIAHGWCSRGGAALTRTDRSRTRGALRWLGRSAACGLVLVTAVRPQEPPHAYMQPARRGERRGIGGERPGGSGVRRRAARRQLRAAASGGRMQRAEDGGGMKRVRGGGRGVGSERDGAGGGRLDAVSSGKELAASSEQAVRSGEQAVRERVGQLLSLYSRLFCDAKRHHGV